MRPACDICKSAVHILRNAFLVSDTPATFGIYYSNEEKKLHLISYSGWILLSHVPNWLSHSSKLFGRHDGCFKTFEKENKLHNLWKICHRSLLKETTFSSLIMWEYFWDEFQTSRKIKYLLYNFWRLLVIFCCTKMTRKVVGKICRYILKLTF